MQHRNKILHIQEKRADLMAKKIGLPAETGRDDLCLVAWHSKHLTRLRGHCFHTIIGFSLLVDFYVIWNKFFQHGYYCHMPWPKAVFVLIKYYNTRKNEADELVMHRSVYIQRTNRNAGSKFNMGGLRVDAAAI